MNELEKAINEFKIAIKSEFEKTYIHSLLEKTVNNLAKILKKE